MIEKIFENFTPYLFIILVVGGWISILFLLYKSYQNKRKREWFNSQEFRLVKISVPKDNEKGPLAAEQMFAALHGIFKPHKERKEEGSLQEHISFEIAASGDRIYFYVWLPLHLKDFIEGQIYAQYPKVEFEEVSDYAGKDFSDYHVVGTEIVLNKNDVFPIKTFLNFEEVDPLSGITSVLSKIESSNDSIWIQILIKPVDDNWQERGVSYVNAVRDGRSPESGGIGSTLKEGTINFIKEIFKTAMSPPESVGSSPQPVRLSSGDESRIKAIEEKISKLGFGVKIRIGYLTKKDNLSSAKIKLKSVVGAFKQFNTVNLNGFQAGSTVIGEQFLNNYKSRVFLDEGYVFNIEELASIFHLPNVSVETPNISWTGSKKGEPPENLPIITRDKTGENISVFAETNFRHKKYKFGIKENDRRRHMYLIGKTGVGKTNMMGDMVISDIEAGHGVGVVDPHGDFVDTIIKYIPKNRINDVVLFDPADYEYPIAFNPLETVEPDQRNLVTSGLVSIFKKIWAESWGPRLEYILRNTIISLLDYPDSTLLGVLRILVDNDYREMVLKKIDDPVIRDFWTKEFAKYNERTRVDAILPIQNKVGQFLSSATIRNIVGQPKSKIDIRYIMDNKKILLVKLAQGKIGEDNSALLGAMIITKMQLAAMSRTDVTEDERVDFYLYVDEFQNFATESFAKILSEARKYRFNLTLANQYIAQLSEGVRDAVFGNMGSIVCFRVGASDARELAKEVEPVFDENDLVNLDKYHIYVKLAIDGMTGNAFSAKTLKIPDETDDNTEAIIRSSRERYAAGRKVVEERIAEWAEKENKSLSQNDSSTGGEEVRDKREEKTKKYREYSEYLDSVKEGTVEQEDKQVKSEMKPSDKEESDINNRPDVPITKSQKIKELTSKIIKHVDDTEKPVKESESSDQGKDNKGSVKDEDQKDNLDQKDKKDGKNKEQQKEKGSKDKGIDQKEIKPGEVVQFK